MKTSTSMPITIATDKLGEFFVDSLRDYIDRHHDIRLHVDYHKRRLHIDCNDLNIEIQAKRHARDLAQYWGVDKEWSI